MSGKTWYDESENYLWQAMGKEELDHEGIVTAEEWSLFIEHYADSFAEIASNAAYDLWVMFLSEHPEIAAREEEPDTEN
jgi:hypothetical protein